MCRSCALVHPPGVDVDEREYKVIDMIELFSDYASGAAVTHPTFLIPGATLFLKREQGEQQPVESP